TSTEAFYLLARLALVKDETRYDRYDRVFAAFIGQLQARAGGPDIPPDWLVQTFRKQLTDEEKAALEKHGWARLMEMFRERLAESRRNATQVAANGSAPGALRPSATAVITRKASASAVHRPATARPSRSGNGATIATTTTSRSWARATSRWRCGACGASPARARRWNWTCRAPSAAPPSRPGCWTCTGCPSATTPSRC